MRTIRVAVCDDVDLVRVSLASFLETDPDLIVSGTYGSGVELLDALPHHPADVLLLDVRMPGLDGPTVAAHLARRSVSPKVIYVTSYPDEVPTTDALSGLVAGCVTKDIPPEDLVRAVHLVARGISLLSPQVMHRVAKRQQHPKLEQFARDERERGVLDLLCRGYTNEQIAVSLHRSTSSVKQILSTMAHRAGVNTRTELVLFIIAGSGVDASPRQFDA